MISQQLKSKVFKNLEEVIENLKKTQYLQKFATIFYNSNIDYCRELIFTNCSMVLKNSHVFFH